MQIHKKNAEKNKFGLNKTTLTYQAKSRKSHNMNESNRKSLSIYGESKDGDTNKNSPEKIKFQKSQYNVEVKTPSHAFVKLQKDTTLNSTKNAFSFIANSLKQEDGDKGKFNFKNLPPTNLIEKLAVGVVKASEFEINTNEKDNEGNEIKVANNGFSTNSVLNTFNASRINKDTIGRRFSKVSKASFIIDESSRAIAKKVDFLNDFANSMKSYCGIQIPTNSIPEEVQPHMKTKEELDREFQEEEDRRYEKFVLNASQLSSSNKDKSNNDFESEDHLNIIHKSSRNSIDSKKTRNSVMNKTKNSLKVESQFVGKRIRSPVSHKNIMSDFKMQYRTGGVTTRHISNRKSNSPRKNFTSEIQS